eukprot:CAMPEP_0114011050 /NCGR_PEP_ID=MMETSP0372-20130328/8104_1 /TAXON_ID=340204 /ORGANISM="Lankesteria abbotti" /LENGTH=42 /assembly_acc=CAM_ASM_000359
MGNCVCMTQAPAQSVYLPMEEDMSDAKCEGEVSDRSWDSTST